MSTVMKRRRIAAVCAALALTAGAGAAYAENRPASRESAPVTAAPAQAKVSFNVVSDVQGDLADFGRALDQMKVVNPGSSALVVNGDITPRGYKAEYDQVKQVLDTRPHPANTFFTIGNHEFYVPKYCSPDKLCQATWPNGTTEQSLFQNFYDFTGLDKVFYERVVDGVPMLFLGTEKYMKYHDDTKWDEVWFSEEQLTWLEQRMNYWESQGKPTFVFSHHVLPDTVSGTRNKLYSADYLQADRIMKILGSHKDAVLFTSHTHWDLNLSDWAVRKVVPETGNLEGFTVVNTGAMETQWTDNGTGGEKSLGRTENSGLQVEVTNDRVVIKARDFLRNKWLKELSVPLHTKCAAAKPWTDSATYTNGDTVVWNNHTWRAKWWTRGEQPGTTGQWGVWEEQGAC
ncbi:DUF4073 domain-containing protein [Streptomyces sp. SID3343]|uniref:DUF4073 domain-containing protein n=1 Tax=Streptomyces sp. SID3343 TaxID=2690260 RepID=UPI001925B403|nr:DUF4073 domain-containing protein [Streptomyces sp. SID3343]